jgi:hypothetical protein
VESTVPSGDHTSAELLTLIGAIRQLAYDQSLDDSDRARRIRDKFGEHDGISADPEE